MNLLRKLKISSLAHIELSRQEFALYTYLKDKLTDTTPYYFPKYPHVIYYMNSRGEWLYILNAEINRITIRHSDIFKPLHYEYLLNGKYICELFFYLIKKKNLIPEKYSDLNYQFIFRTTYKEHIKTGSELLEIFQKIL
jgi:hypothetical protein